jgi:tetratricopeptide (TPR) repeat protein
MTRKKIIQIVVIVLAFVLYAACYLYSISEDLQRVWFTFKGPSAEAKLYLEDGRMKHDLNNLLEAIEAYNKCIYIEPYYAEAYFYLGLAKHGLNMYDIAIDDYTQAIMLGYKPAWVYYSRGTARMFSKHYHNTNSLDDFGKAIAIDPNHALSYYNRGVLYKSRSKSGSPLSDNDLILAIRNFKDAIRSDPHGARAYIRLGEIEYDLGLIEDAQTNFIKAINIAEGANDCEVKNEARKALRERYPSYSR